MPFFPNFALRDLLLWILAVNLLALLAVLLPLRPGHPRARMGARHQGRPAQAGLSRNQAGVVLPLDVPAAQGVPGRTSSASRGPQVCLARRQLLMGIWALVPFLDRSAARRTGRARPSPTSASRILYLLRLPHAESLGRRRPPAPRRRPERRPGDGDDDPRTAAGWTLGARRSRSPLPRAALSAHSFFWISAIALLQVILHGYFGVPLPGRRGDLLVLVAARRRPDGRRSRRWPAPRAAILLVLLARCCPVGLGGHRARRRRDRRRPRRRPASPVPSPRPSGRPSSGSSSPRRRTASRSSTTRSGRNSATCRPTPS